MLHANEYTVTAYWNGFGYRAVLGKSWPEGEILYYVSQDGYKWCRLLQNGGTLALDTLNLDVHFSGGPRSGETAHY